MKLFRVNFYPSILNMYHGYLMFKCYLFIITVFTNLTLVVDMGWSCFGCSCSVYTYICGLIYIWCCQWLLLYWRKVIIKIQNGQCIKFIESLRKEILWLILIVVWIFFNKSLLHSLGLRTFLVEMCLSLHFIFFLQDHLTKLFSNYAMGPYFT